MSRHLFINRYQWIGIAGLLWSLIGAIAPVSVQAQVPLTRADVESLENRVEVMLRGQAARSARLSDWLGVGDTLRTAASSRAELRFNDGSLARVGERATFRFLPDTRTFRLSNGTVLFLIPPGRGPSTIQTPSAVTGIQGTALVVRHIPFPESTDSTQPINWEQGQNTEALSECDAHGQPIAADSADNLPASLAGCGAAVDPGDGAIAEAPGRTIVMVLTDNPNGPVEVTTPDGQTEALAAGYMAVIEENAIQVLEFDLELFYQTSPLVDGLNLDDSNAEDIGSPTDPVRQETLDGLESQRDFVGGYLLDPAILSSETRLSPTTNWLVPPTALDPLLPTDPVSGRRPSGETPSRPIDGSPVVVEPGGTPSTAVPPGLINPGTSVPQPNQPNPPGPPNPGPNPPNPPGQPNPVNPPGQPNPVNPPGQPNPVNPPGQPNPVNPPGQPNPVNPPNPAGPANPVNPPNPAGPANPAGQPNPVNQPNPVGQPNPLPATNFEVNPAGQANPITPAPNNTPADVNTTGIGDINPPGVIPVAPENNQ
ncbi:MAG: FecR domain-containing protein [Leptolyngbya sp. SIO1E4]|nr:FecR domain-containing protein [Leptolyngbya sp. SIO1E4]